ncbi:phage terminase large subunit family protein, partial [Citrobacter freundii]|nr:phage terminase large subunit family protein [Citrobacter freundii]
PHEAPPTTGILSLYNRGDRRRWYWPCPHCGEYFQPAMEAMTGYRETSDPVKASEAAHIDCPHCSGMITADRKRELNGKGVWLREGQTIDREGNITGEARRSRIASFWMEGPAAAYQTWAQLVYKLLTAEQDYEATGSEETLKTVINTDWGLPYLPRAASEQRRADVLMLRAEDYGKRLVPPKVRFLLASVDVQGGKKRRFVVQIIGYGENGERWLVDRYNIRQSLRCDENGEAQQVHPGSYPEDWQLLITDVLEKTYGLQSDSSRRMPILAMAVDSGGEDGVTDNAYKFWRQCRRDGLGKRVYLIKGDSTRRQKIITKTHPDNTGRSDRRADARGEVPVYLLQTDLLKDQLSNNLERETPGAGYIHFPDWLGEWFYEELTYEERGTDGKWRKPGKGNNEAFDLFCYAHAVAVLRGYEKIRDWEQPPVWAAAQESNSNIIDGEHPREIAVKKAVPVRSSPVPESEQSSPLSGGWLGVSGNGGWL